ncbi:MAG TPA: phage tail tube protein [Xanthobacteraceae bacterium]|nr:phage tail tube protein [Xanthobacteraceae bacterium]
MAKRFFRKLAVLTKAEVTYGVDSTPTGAANAMQMTAVSITPLGGEEESRELLLPYFGHQGVLLVGNYVELQGSVELAGAGAAGTVPAYGALLRACSMSEVTVAATSVTYAPVSNAPESAVIYANFDGVNHAMLGVRGTWSLELAPKRIPRIRFTLRGLLGPIADVALPAVTLTGFKKPLVVSTVNTPTRSLHGYAALWESVSLDIGNTVELRNLIGEDSVQITNRQSIGTAVIEAASMAIKNWFSIAQAHTVGALSVIHGVGAGNIVEIAAAGVQLGRPTQGQTQGILNYSIPLMFTPTAGDDEFSIIVR